MASFQLFVLDETTLYQVRWNNSNCNKQRLWLRWIMTDLFPHLRHLLWFAHKFSILERAAFGQWKHLKCFPLFSSEPVHSLVNSKLSMNKQMIYCYSLIFRFVVCVIFVPRDPTKLLTDPRVGWFVKGFWRHSWPTHLNINIYMTDICENHITLFAYSIISITVLQRK